MAAAAFKFANDGGNFRTSSLIWDRVQVTIIRSTVIQTMTATISRAIVDGRLEKNNSQIRELHVD